MATLKSIKPKRDHGFYSMSKGGVLVPSGSLVNNIIGVQNWLFEDTFVNGVRAGAQNGIFYKEHVNHPEFNPPSILSVAVDAGSPTGYSLCAGFGTPTTTFTAGAFTIEEHFGLPSMQEIFIEQTTYADPDCFHANKQTSNNNKHLRLWDTNYSGSKVHIGYSVRSRSTRQTTAAPFGTGNGSGSLEVEYSVYPSTGAGNNGKGPYTAVFTPGTETRIGFYSHVASAAGVPDGVIKMWVNDVQVIDLNNLNICLAGGTVNLFQNGFIFGPANSGFGVDALHPVNPTNFRVRRLRIAATPPY